MQLIHSELVPQKNKKEKTLSKGVKTWNLGHVTVRAAQTVNTMSETKRDWMAAASLTHLSLVKSSV